MSITINITGDNVAQVIKDVAALAASLNGNTVSVTPNYDNSKACVCDKADPVASTSPTKEDEAAAAAAIKAESDAAAAKAAAKAEKAAAKAAAEAKAKADEVKAAAEAKTAAPTADKRSLVREAGMKLIQTQRSAELKAAITALGSPSITALAEDKLDAALAQLNALLEVA